MKRPTRRPSKPARVHTSLSCYVADSAAVREITRRTGMRIDATVAALVRLFDQSTAEARLAAGFPAFPALPAAAHEARRTSEAHEAPNPTSGAAA